MISMIFTQEASAGKKSKKEKSGIALGDKVEAVDIRDSSNDPVPLPSIGEKLVLLFYIDPDKPKYNREFYDRLTEEDFPTEIFHCYGIVNLKDAPLLPNGIVRFMIRREEEAYKDKGAKVYTDPSHILKKAWNLTDLNNKAAVILINDNKEVVFYQTDEMTPENSEDLIKLIWSNLNDKQSASLGTP